MRTMKNSKPTAVIGRIVLVLMAATGIFTGNVYAQTPFSLMAIGDAGDSSTVLAECARSMLTTADGMARRGDSLGMLLFLGDNFYITGLNQSQPARERLVERILGPHRELMERLGPKNVQAIAGNHDYYCRALSVVPANTCFGGNHFEQQIDIWTYHYGYPVGIRRPIFSGSRDSVELILFDSGLPLAIGPEAARQGFDSLERLLRRSAAAPGVRWRILAAHHSPYTLGEHGGWRRWIPEYNQVRYIGNCIDEMEDPFRYAQEFFSAQDNCTPWYRAYSDSLQSVIARSGARIQVMFAGHDHSLQLMNYPDSTCSICPHIFVISGAGSKRERVKSPSPPHEFSHPFNDPQERGRSAGGFVTCGFEQGALRIVFVDATDGKPLDMGNGWKSFRVSESGELLQTP